MREVVTERAMEWLDSVLLPRDDEYLYFRVRVWSRDVNADPEGRVGIWRGFQRGWLYGFELIIGDEDGSWGSSLHMPPGNLIDVEVLEAHYERPEEDW